MAVKHMAMLANISPPTKARKMTNGNSGLKAKPKAAIATTTTPNTTEAFIIARVAPQMISPAMTSFHAYRRSDDGVERFLEIHPNERRVSALKEGACHNRNCH